MREVNYTARALMVMRVVSLTALFATWEMSVRGGWVDPAFFGQPSLIFKSLVAGLSGDALILRELGFTMWTAFISFVIGAGGAVVVALLFVLFPVLEKVLDPI